MLSNVDINSCLNYKHFTEYKLSKKQIRSVVANAALLAIHREELPRIAQNLKRLKNYSEEMLKQKIQEVTKKRDTLREEIGIQINKEMKDEFHLEIDTRSLSSFKLKKESYSSVRSLLIKRAGEPYKNIPEDYELLTDSNRHNMQRAVLRLFSTHIGNKLHASLTEEENIICELKTFIEDIITEDLFQEDIEHVDIFSGIFKKADLKKFFLTLEKYVADKMISFVLTSKEYVIILSYSKNSNPHWTLINPDQSLVQKCEGKDLPEKIYESIEAKDSAGCIIQMYCDEGQREEINHLTHEWRQQAHHLTKFLPTEPSELANELFEAIKGNKIYRAKQLLAAKADLNTGDDKGITPVMAAVLQDKSDILKLLIAHKANVTLTDNNGQTALHKAAETNYYELIDILLVHCKVNF